jgi:hypothetical protein
MKRPQFFEDIDLSLQGIDVEELRRTEAAARQREHEEALEKWTLARISARGIGSPFLYATSLVAPSITYFPLGPMGVDAKE